MLVYEHKMKTLGKSADEDCWQFIILLYNVSMTNNTINRRSRQISNRDFTLFGIAYIAVLAFVVFAMSTIVFGYNQKSSNITNSVETISHSQSSLVQDK